MLYKQSNLGISVAATMLAVVCVLAASAFGQSGDNITVTAPTTNSTVTWPVQVSATFSGCGGTSTGFGYSVESSPFITWGQSTTVINNTDYRLTPGNYSTIHFKGWSGTPLCELNITNVTVTGPSNITTVPNIEDYPNSQWKWVKDTGTPGTASGTTNLVNGSPCQDSECREFTMTFTDGGGMRGSTSFGSDPNHLATHFVYDTYVYFLNTTEYVQNIELDTNQVWDSNNDVLIYGLQCANDGHWQYTTYSGWHDSNVTCPKPSTWSPNSWHHVQLAVHRDDSGNAYYDSVTLDGKTSNFTNAYGNSSFALDWAAGDLVLNFQLDGLGSSGSITAYVDGLTEIYW
jgi:hypothetical protein